MRKYLIKLGKQPETILTSDRMILLYGEDVITRNDPVTGKVHVVSPKSVRVPFGNIDLYFRNAADAWVCKNRAERFTLAEAEAIIASWKSEKTKRKPVVLGGFHCNNSCVVEDTETWNIWFTINGHNELGPVKLPVTLSAPNYKQALRSWVKQRPLTRPIFYEAGSQWRGKFFIKSRSLNSSKVFARYLKRVASRRHLYLTVEHWFRERDSDIVFVKGELEDLYRLQSDLIRWRNV